MNLNNILEFDFKRPEFTLIESSGTDGSFLMHHLLNSILRDASPSLTFLLTFSQTLSHYKSVQIKLGNSTQLNQALANEKLVHIDQMTQLSQCELEITTTSSSNNDENDEKTRLKRIFDKAIPVIKEKVDAASKDESVFVLFDDLSVLNLIGVKDNLVLQFLSKIRLIRDEKMFIGAYCQAFYGNRSFLGDLRHMADLVVKTESLTTGYSKEINGQVNYY